MFTWVASAWTTAGRKNDLRLLARGAQLGEQVFVDALRILIHGVDEPRAIGPLAHDRVRDVEIVEPGDQLPLLAVQAPDLVLFPLRHFSPGSPQRDRRASHGSAASPSRSARAVRRSLRAHPAPLLRVRESFILNAKGRRMAGPGARNLSITLRFHPLPARARA